MKDDRRVIAVVGGGISGLAAAHRLIELRRQLGLPIRVALLEAAHRLGGVISTVTRDGYLLEEGPDSFITDKPWARELADRLGLSSRLIGTQDSFRRSFVVRRNRLHPTPDGFYLLAPTRFLPFVTTRVFSPLGKIRMAMDLVIPRAASAGDESVASFVRRRLGSEALERMAQPMIGGIYAADPAELSLRATFPRFLQMEEEHGSVIRGLLATGRRRAAIEGAREASGPRYGLFVSFDGGLRVLPDTLAASLPEGTSRTEVRVTRVSRIDAGRWRVEATGVPTPEDYDAVILALPAFDAAGPVRAIDAEMADLLGSIPYGSAATVSLAFREQDVEHPLDGFGCVIPAIEELSLIGCTFTHRKYARRAPQGHALIRAFWGDASAGLTDSEIVGRTLSDLRTVLGVRGAPLLSHLVRHHRSMPRYAVGHLDLVDRIEDRLRRHPGLALAGNAYRGVGIPDCVRSGEAAAESAARHLGLFKG